MNKIIQYVLENFGFIIKPKILLNSIKVKSKNLTYLDKYALLDLAQVIYKTNRLKGIIVETGTALGGSAILIAKIKNKSTQLHLYDTFEQIPPPSDNDSEDVHKRYEEIIKGTALGIGDDPYYGYQENLLSIVKNNFYKFKLPPEKNNIYFHKGLFEDTLKITEPVKMAHIDCDWYDSVKKCLEEIIPNLSNNGIVIIDDYYDWSGCKKAVDEYFSDIVFKENFLFEQKSRLHIKKLR